MATSLNTGQSRAAKSATRPEPQLAWLGFARDDALHAVHPDFEALIEIETFAFYAGSLPSAARKEVLKWAMANLAVIKAEWNRINPRFPVK
jgi:hypothetical protein